MFKVGAGLSVLGGIWLLSACATLNEQECQTVDWQALGDRDGVSGFAQTRLAKHVKACAKHTVNADEKAYSAGWRVGITRYCTPQNGFNVGKSAQNYRNACPSELEGPFLEAYTISRAVRDAEADIRNIEWDIENDVDQLSRLATSKKPEDLAKVVALRDDLKHQRRNLESARLREEIAQRDLLDFLRANPQIKA